jgi:Ca-activated chloride channel family protein
MPENPSTASSYINQWLAGGSKVSRFAVLGAIGCLAGSILGELLLMAIKSGPPTPSQAVCLLIDCSGSMMDGRKLQEVKSAATQFVTRQVQNNSPNAIAVVGFGTGVHPTANMGADAAQLNIAIQSLYDNGGTQMDAGLSVAADQLTGSSVLKNNASIPCNILLFTDGQPTNPQATLEAARACREKKIRIVAIGTGDADINYLAQVTGDPKLVFPATSGSFGESFEKAEKAIYGPALMESSKSQSGFFHALFSAGAWTALLAVGVSLALIAGQNLYLHRTALSSSDITIGVVGGIAAGVVAGLAGQFSFFIANLSSNIPVLGTIFGWLMIGVGRIVGWAILGALVGRGLAFFVPNLPPKRALIAGGLGGGCAAIVFIVTSIAGDGVGRLLGAAVLGAFLGMAVALVETLYRQWWLEVRMGEKEVIQVNLGATPVKIGSDNRACTIYARGVRPLAAQYQVQDNRVMFLDYATEIATEISVGDQRAIGHVTLTVRGKSTSEAESKTESSAPPTQTVRAAPPPPKPKNAPADVTPQTPFPQPPKTSTPPPPPVPKPATQPNPAVSPNSPPPKTGGAIFSAPPPPTAKLPISPGETPRTIRPIPPREENQG